MASTRFRKVSRVQAANSDVKSVSSAIPAAYIAFPGV